VTVSSADSLAEAARVMAEHTLTHLIVVDPAPDTRSAFCPRSTSQPPTPTPDQSVQKWPTWAAAVVTIGSGAIDSASPAPSSAAIVATTDSASAAGS